jgi:hypothetical protein
MKILAADDESAPERRKKSERPVQLQSPPEEGFREQLTNDPDAARADRGAHRQFMLPRRAPRQQ